MGTHSLFLDFFLGWGGGVNPHEGSCLGLLLGLRAFRTCRGAGLGLGLGLGFRV